MSTTDRILQDTTMEEDGPSFKDEFKLKNFGLGYDKPYKFSLSEWRWPHGVYVAWRVFWALWHIGWLARSVQHQVATNDGEKWFIYLTHWSFLILTIQSILHLVVVINSRCKGKTSADDFDDETSTSWLEKLLWFFTTISFDAAILVTIMYWAFIFVELKIALSIMTHAVTTLYAISDMFISASPYRILHFVYASGYGLLYGLFTVFYHVGDGTNNDGKPYVYSIIDWSNVGMSVGLTLGLVFVAIPILHLFMFGLYTLRVFMSQRCGCGKRSDSKDNAA